MNAQPLQYIVVRDRATIERLAKVQGFIGGASVVIAIVADPAASKYWLEDASAAAENMLLAMTALGYAGVWLDGVLRFNDLAARIGRLLGVPEEFTVRILLPLGVADEPKAQKEKLPFERRAWFNRYGG